MIPPFDLSPLLESFNQVVELGTAYLAYLAVVRSQQSKPPRQESEEPTPGPRPQQSRKKNKKRKR